MSGERTETATDNPAESRDDIQLLWSERVQELKIIVGFMIGGVVGVVLVRAFFLNGLEELGWRLFWEGFLNGHLMNLGDVLNSSTFWKVFFGFLLCGFGGVLISQRVSLKPRDRSP